MSIKKFLPNSVEVVTTTVFDKPKTPANQEKIDIMTDMYKVIQDEDVDTFFIAFVEAANRRGFKLKGTACALINQIDAKHNK